MKKIAILTCEKSNDVCTGASCLKAFNHRLKSFRRYENAEIELMAFMKCNGCECDYDTDSGYLEKLERIEQIGVEVVHVGVCTKGKDGSYCSKIDKIINDMKQRGIEIVDGTH